jgi:fatty-acyl-CoA synthase
MPEATPTVDTDLPRRFADFPTLVDALEYAAKGVRGINFYSSRGEIEEVVPYSELRDQAAEIGARLVGAGFETGDRIAVIAQTNADFVRFFLGCQYASVLPVPLPLPTSFGGHEGYVRQLARQMDSCGATAVITPEIMKDLVIEAASDQRFRFKGTPEEFFASATKKGELRYPQPDDLAYLQYSSGSTRFPHGIAVTHKSLLSNCFGMGYHGVQLVDDDRGVSWLPFYHDMGLVGTFLTSLTCQVTVDYLATEDFARRPLMWLSLMSRNKATITYSPTFGYDICARRVGPEALAALDLSAWRVAGIGGDMIRVDVMDRFAETFSPAGFKPTTFVASYGLAECTLAVSFMPINTGIEIDRMDERVLSGELPSYAATSEPANSSYGVGPINGHIVEGPNHANGYRSVVNCGLPLPEYDVAIRDSDGNQLIDHEIGRVFLRGPSIMREYFGDPDATRQVLSEDGWLDTGDMGYMLDGYLYIVGRAKDLIIVNGRNHWPQDIEWAVEQLPGMRSGDIAAISLPGENAEEVPVVLVQCRLNDREARQKFAQRVRTQISTAVGVNCRIELVAPRTLPRTSSGKLSRARARSEFLSGGLTALAH